MRRLPRCGLYENGWPTQQRLGLAGQHNDQGVNPKIRKWSTDVRLGAHSGLKSEIAALLKSANRPNASWRIVKKRPPTKAASLVDFTAWILTSLQRMAVRVYF
jgi:hypothetical protein